MVVNSADTEAGGIDSSLTDVRRETVSENAEAWARTIEVIVEMSRLLGGYSPAAGRKRSGNFESGLSSVR